ncbi:hypothetical protein FSP39_009937 [Pinctada imbricata]|uniref:Uncharacterized protein n=1 Tax=Pinctada imbricata TaxID=66713 RepID=A0AA88XXG2_PINIB|nr:hypothetical protein FSP39_009937 [Pinctada imbricata]
MSITNKKQRSNGNMNGGQDIMMNLLGESSESDNTTLLDLPPIKGKKPKRRKTNYGPPAASSCSLWFILKSFLILTLVCAVSVLGFVTVWLSGEVTELKNKLETG